MSCRSILKATLFLALSYAPLIQASPQQDVRDILIKSGVEQQSDRQDTLTLAAHDVSNDVLNTRANPWINIPSVIGENSRIGQSGWSDSATTLTIQGHRPILTYLYFPKHITGNTIIPVVIASTQYSTSPTAYSNLFRHLSSHGYLVIAPLHLDAILNGGGLSSDNRQSRINDIHDMIRSLFILKAMTHLNLSLDYNLIGFRDGGLDCLLNSGMPSDNTHVTGWPGSPRSVLLVQPDLNTASTKLRLVSTPILVAATIDGLNLNNGAVAQSPSNSVRILAAIQGFDDPLMSVSRQNTPAAFMWESLVTTWLNAEALSSAKDITAFDNNDFDTASDNRIRTQSLTIAH